MGTSSPAGAGRGARLTVVAWLGVLAAVAGAAFLGRQEPAPSEPAGPTARSPAASRIAAAEPTVGTDGRPAPTSRTVASPLPEATPVGTAFASGARVVVPAAGRITSSGLVRVVARLEPGRGPDVQAEIDDAGTRIGSRALVADDAGRVAGHVRVTLSPVPIPARVRLIESRSARVLAEVPIVLERGGLVITAPYEADSPLQAGDVLVTGRAYAGVGDVRVRLLAPGGRVLARATALTYRDLSSAPASIIFTTRLPLPGTLPAGRLRIEVRRAGSEQPLVAAIGVRAADR